MLGKLKIDDPDKFHFDHINQIREYKFDQIRFYNKVSKDQERQINKYKKAIKKVLKYKIGEKVLLKNRELPSTMEGITNCLLYTSRCV